RPAVGSAPARLPRQRRPHARARGHQNPLVLGLLRQGAGHRSALPVGPRPVHGDRRGQPGRPGGAAAPGRGGRQLLTRAGSTWPHDVRFGCEAGSVRADRLVATLLILQARGRVTAAELAAELEVSERTARRDLEALAMAGIPVYSQAG